MKIKEMNEAEEFLATFIENNQDVETIAAILLSICQSEKGAAFACAVSAVAIDRLRSQSTVFN